MSKPPSRMLRIGAISISRSLPISLVFFLLVLADPLLGVQRRPSLSTLASGVTGFVGVRLRRVRAASSAWVRSSSVTFQLCLGSRFCLASRKRANRASVLSAGRFTVTRVSWFSGFQWRMSLYSASGKRRLSTVRVLLGESRFAWMARSVSCKPW